MCLVTIIAVVKFVLYYFSHSNAVLSEAWHSFSDVATTALVVFAVYHQRKKNKIIRQESQKSPKSFKPLYTWWRSIYLELKISFCIGLVLIAVSGSILWFSGSSHVAHVKNPMVTGWIFVGLSIISFFVYKFEASLATMQQSAALKADSMHNRADMVISLLTGISLILYHLGYNFDRFLGMGIAFYILTFAVEMAVNSLVSIFKGQAGIATNYNFTTIMWRIFDPNIYIYLFQRLDSLAGFSQNSKDTIKTAARVLKKIYPWTLGLAASGVAVMYCSTMFFTVQADQHAFVDRFGKLLNPEKLLGPGLHLKCPWPIDTVYWFNTQKISELSVGNAAGQDTPLIWNQEHGDNKMFISGDNNLFLPYVKIFYKLEDPLAYYFSFKNNSAHNFLKYTAYQSLIHIFAANAFYDIALLKRKEWQNLAKQTIQADLDHFKTGLKIVELSINDLHPPLEIATSYEEVVAACQVREKYKNSAQGYAFYKRIKEQSDGLKTVCSAQSDVFEKIQIAQGEALNYLCKLKGYNLNRVVMNRLMTLDNVQKALERKPKILIDPKSGISKELMYLENYMKKRQAQ